MEIFYLRTAERILIVVTGLICILLGYALFKIPYSRAGASNAELVAKGAGFEITLRHVWPGVFFAAFGMIVMVASILTQLKMPAQQLGADSSSQGVTYQGGGGPPADSKTRASNAIAAIGQMLTMEPASAASSPQRATAIARLATAQIDLIDIAYGQGSYEKFTDISSKSKMPAEFLALPERDRQFFEDLRTALQR